VALPVSQSQGFPRGGLLEQEVGHTGETTPGSEVDQILLGNRLWRTDR